MSFFVFGWKWFKIVNVGKFKVFGLIVCNIASAADFQTFLRPWALMGILFYNIVENNISTRFGIYTLIIYNFLLPC